MKTPVRLTVFAVAVAAAVGIGAAAGSVLGPLGADTPAEQMPADHVMTDITSDD